MKSHQDLLKIERLILGAKDVPIGAYARVIFDQLERIYGDGFVSALRSRIVSHEHNVRVVRTKIEMDEADAGFVYRTDAMNRPKLNVFALPPDSQISTPCLIGLLNRGHSINESAQRFYNYVLSESGQAILKAHHFLPAGDP